MTWYFRVFSVLIVANKTPFAAAADPVWSGAPMQTTPHGPTGAQAYASNFEDYDYFIGSVGWVTIQDVTLADSNLTAVYTYVANDETLHVRSELRRDTDGLYRGTCSTTLNGIPRFSVSTTLGFSDDGTASGNWAWSGEPSSVDPAVLIRKRGER